MTRVDRAEFGRLVRSFKRSAWRWECQGVYHEPSERKPFQLWQQGQIDRSYLERPWLQRVRQLRAAGRTWERARMLTDPLTEYLRWMLEFTYLNVEAGEDIRWLGEADARRLGAPGYDYYLLDDELVVVLEFGDQGVTGAEVTDDAGRLAAARAWRDLAWANATPHAEYMTTRSS